jgi:hypothetical protein
MPLPGFVSTFIAIAAPDVQEFEEFYGGGNDTASQQHLVTNLFLKASETRPQDADGTDMFEIKSSVLFAFHLQCFW